MADLQASRVAGRWSVWTALLACLPFVVLAIVHRHEQASVFSGDWAQYVSHAKALASGRSYSDIGYLYSPLAWTIGPRAYPPGLPLTLLPLLIFGDHAMAAMRVLMVVSAIGFLVFASRRLSLVVPPLLALVVVAWCGVMLELGRASVQVLSDLGFCFFAWWALSEVDAEGPWTRGRMARVALAGLGAMAYRVVGIAVPAAVVGYLLIAPRSQRRPLLTVVGVWAACGGLVLAIAPHLIPSRFFTTGLPSLRSLLQQLLSWRFAIAEVQGYPFVSSQLNDAYHLAATLLAGIGAVAILRRHWRSMLPIFIAVYGAALMAVSVFDQRYFWPLFPVILGAQLEGLRLLLRTSGLTAVPAQVRVVGGAVALLVTGVLWRERGQSVVEGFDAYPDAQAVMTFARAAAERGEGPRFLFVNPRVFTLETGVPAMGQVTARPSTVMQELARLRITHVVFGSFRDGCGPRTLDRTRLAYPQSFQTVARYGRFDIATLTVPDSAALARPAVEDRSPGELSDCKATGWEVTPVSVPPTAE